MLHLLVAFTLLAAPESKTVTLARQEALTLVAEKHTNLLIQKFIEGLTCVDGGPWPKAACASMGRDVDEATDADNKAMQDHGPYTTCEIYWTTTTAFRNAAKELRNRADKGVAYLQDAGSTDNDLAAILAVGFRNRSREYTDDADKEWAEFRKRGCLIAILQ